MLALSVAVFISDPSVDLSGHALTIDLKVFVLAVGFQSFTKRCIISTLVQFYQLPLSFLSHSPINCL